MFIAAIQQQRSRAANGGPTEITPRHGHQFEIHDEQNTHSKYFARYGFLFYYQKKNKNFKNCIANKIVRIMRKSRSDV